MKHWTNSIKHIIKNLEFLLRKSINFGKKVMSSKSTNAVLGLFIAIGLSILGYAIYSSAKYLKSRDRVVNVKGLSEREVKANIAIWPIRFKQVGNDLGVLFNELEKKQSMILDFLHDKGFEDEEISIGQIATNDRVADAYSNQNTKFRYISTNTITVYTHKVDLTRETMNQIGELGKKGVAIEPYNYDNRLEFLFTGLNEIKPQMVEEATAKARVVAQKFASDSQSKLGKIKQAYQGQFSIYDRDSNTPHIKKVRVVTTMVYYLVD